ncbi:AraC family transcriptional regulator [Dyadobacter fermentans]|uniref:Transcriptional regulator, AraC family n=1 Tax=Dyadobacter fermentans (strain ATCC 700827 / DSM 18053 / CIP 107007 / KCTC 52180 / NS114) TaxID=471854 RepID=C6VUW2_DYAFD|nr:AraC family transcriptional regulator [Dyadobacter fermentans]ACT93099.1 transcriptional regulator, AraC family [Dyadobacter fermentans DSM 18053]
MSNVFRRRDGFDGEKLISLPPGILKDVAQRNPALFQIYITHIGYFPKALFHYRERRKGCEDNILIYCIQGKGHYVIGDKKFEVSANQFILLPATDQYIRYWADHDDPWTIYWVHFTGAGIDNFNQSLQIAPQKGPVDILFNEKTLDIWHRIYQSLEMGYSLENLANATMCLHYFTAMFLFPEKHLTTEGTEKTDLITETITHMRLNLDQKLSVEDMARQHQLSCSHFSMLFRKGTGMAPVDYFIHLKMQKACQLIYANEGKIKEIAMSLGYDDPFYFSRVFKKNMGQSPEQYKLTAKKLG